MIVAFDANVLVYLFDEKANAPVSKATGRAVERCQERVEYLIATLQQERAKIIIPTPSLGEVLVRAQEGAPERLALIKASKHFRISPFDERAAVEYAAMQIDRRRSGIKSEAASKAKAKFDDQIVAIAAIEGATIIYSDDGDIKKLVGSGVQVLGIEDLPLPPEESQGTLDFDQPASGQRHATDDDI